jgi:hypothetical protein
MWHIRGKIKIRTGSWRENENERDHLKDPGMDMILLK